MKNKKAQMTLFIVFIIAGVIIITVTAFVAPMMVKFNTEMYEAGEKIYLDTKDDIEAIENATARNRIGNVIDRGLNAVDTNIDVNNAMFQYGWIFVLALTALVVFLLTRRLIEYGGGGLV